MVGDLGVNFVAGTRQGVLCVVDELALNGGDVTGQVLGHERLQKLVALGILVSRRVDGSGRASDRVARLRGGDGSMDEITEGGGASLHVCGVVSDRIELLDCSFG